MKTIALGLLLGLGMLMVGCGESTPPKKPDAKPTAAMTPSATPATPAKTDEKSK